MAQEREVIVKVTPKLGDVSAFRQAAEEAQRVADAAGQAAGDVGNAWQRVGQQMMAAQTGPPRPPQPPAGSPPTGGPANRGGPIDVRVVWPEVLPVEIRGRGGSSGGGGGGAGFSSARPAGPAADNLAGVFNGFDQSVIQPTEQMFGAAMKFSRGVAILTGQQQGMESLIQTYMKFQAVTDVVRGAADTVRGLVKNVQAIMDLPLGGNALKNLTGFFGGITESADKAKAAVGGMAAGGVAGAAAPQVIQVAHQQIATAIMGGAGAAASATTTGAAAATGGGAAAATGGGGGAAATAAGGTTALAATAITVAVPVLAAIAGAAVTTIAAVPAFRDMLARQISGSHEAYQQERRLITQGAGGAGGYFGVGPQFRHSQQFMGMMMGAAGRIRSANDRIFEEESRLRHAPRRVAAYNLDRDRSYHSMYLGRAYEQLSRPGSRQANLMRDLSRVDVELRRGDANAQGRINLLGRNSAESQELQDRINRTRGQLDRVNNQVELRRRARELRGQIQLATPNMTVGENTFTNAAGQAENTWQWTPPVWGLTAPQGSGEFRRAWNWYGNLFNGSHLENAANAFWGTGETAGAPTQVNPGSFMVPGTQQAFQTPGQVQAWVQQQQAAGNEVPQQLQQIADQMTRVADLQEELEAVNSQIDPAAAGSLEPGQGGMFGAMENLTAGQDEYNALLQRQQELQQEIAQQQEQQVQLLRQQRQELRDILEERRQEHQQAAERFRTQAQSLQDQSSSEATSFALMDEPTQQRYMDFFRTVAGGGELLPDLRQEALGMGGPLADMIREQARQRVVGIDGQGNGNTAAGRMWQEIMATGAPNQLSRNQQIEAYQQAARREQAEATRIEAAIRNEFNVEMNSGEIVDRLRDIFEELIQSLSANLTAQMENQMNTMQTNLNAATTGGGN